jgi:UDP-2,3-diacylglucosamine hydrolase
VSVLLLSDLHLKPGNTAYGEAFRAFLSGPARKARAVYILGDLFEYWIGDDVSMPEYQAEVDAIRELAGTGVPVYLQRGNRDFLLGAEFLKYTGAQMLADPVVCDIEGEPTLLSHGDIWCTEDRAYQRWRRFSHNAIAQWCFLRLPARRRRRIAEGMRGKSRDQARDETILDVTPTVVDGLFSQYGVRRVIHGHTHRPATHTHTDGIRIVLPDWRPRQCGWIEIDGEQIHQRV